MKKFSEKEIEAYHKRIGITRDERIKRRLAEGWSREEIEAEMNAAIMMFQTWIRDTGMLWESEKVEHLAKLCGTEDTE